ncbi:MAG: hypothetical protein Q4B69_08055 [Slackia sp.]|nr:hypothetical protein [Slackia sp.]
MDDRGQAMSARCFLMQGRRVVFSRATFVLAAIAALLAALTMASPATDFGGPMFMMAGRHPEVIGGAIGFIGNIVDESRPALSALRTAFLYTVLWAPVSIIYMSIVFSSDYACGAARVSRARGSSLGALAAAKALWASACIVVCYLCACLVAFAFKSAQYGVVLQPFDFAPFFHFASANAAVLCAAAAWSIPLFAFFKSTIASVFAQLVVFATVLLGYPSAFGTASLAGVQADPFPWCMAPAYYLLHVSSLSTCALGVAAPFFYTIVSCAIAALCTVLALRVREV